MDKLIITTALTGAITVPSQTPHLPITPEQISSDAIASAAAGATAVHIHARNPENGAPSSDPEIVRDIAQRIKASSNVIVGVTSGGGMGMTPEDRLRATRDLEPEVASFNLGSINFSMHPVARRFAPDDWKHDWEEGYVKGTKILFSVTLLAIWKSLPKPCSSAMSNPNLKCMTLGICTI